MCLRSWLHGLHARATVAAVLAGKLMAYMARKKRCSCQRYQDRPAASQVARLAAPVLYIVASLIHLLR